MRNYKRKTNRGRYSKETIENAVRRVISNNESIRSVAGDLNICHLTLWRYVRKARQCSQSTNIVSTVGYANSFIFSVEQSNKLAEYIKYASQIYFGITPMEARKLAYECAVAYKIKIPSSWVKNQAAGPDWLTSFLKRHPNLSIRAPESTSLGRATSFNKNNVTSFFDKLAELRDRYSFSSADIWNVDETGVTTVQRLGKIIAQKGVKQVGGITSSERGTLVTLCVAVSATGNSVPPMFVFPRKRYHDHFIRDGPNGSVGAGNKSGWMAAEEFYNFIQHFIKHVRPSKTNPILLLLDNHESHLAIKSINLARENGVIMLSFPPHCSHRLQPLDRSVYGPFKKYLSSAQDAWLRNNPGKAMTIYDVPKLVNDALPRALAPSNIINGFKVSGIDPFNSDIFSDDDYLPSSVTDRPLEILEEVNLNLNNAHTACSVNSIKDSDISSNIINKNLPSNSAKINENRFNIPINDDLDLALQAPIIFECIDVPNEVAYNIDVLTSPADSNVNNSTNSYTFSPETIRPFPKVGPRKITKQVRKKRKAAILTDTPEKDALAREQTNKKSKNIVKKKLIRKFNNTKDPKKSKPTKNILKKEKNLKNINEPTDWFCLLCKDAYSQSKQGEIWVMCIKCKGWAHENCTDKQMPFKCNSCYN